jgi:hypothetical protein
MGALAIWFVLIVVTHLLIRVGVPREYFTNEAGDDYHSRNPLTGA